ncbi:MAG TPA: YggT family protein [Alphaproteobacteria bacterium]
MALIGSILIWLLQLYTFIIIVQVILSWLVAFGVLNLSNPQAAKLAELLEKLTEPVMAPVRKFIPSIGGIDISPIIVIFGIMLLEQLISRIFLNPFGY